MFESAIDLLDVTKVYRGNVHALSGVSLNVHRGEVFGLLGPNGAGKSTLIKIMMTVVRASTANGTILGHPVGHKPTLARVGYLPEHHRFPRYLTGRQTLEFFASLSGVDRVTRKHRASELLELVGMNAWADRLVGLYSKGMMQRIGIAQALVSDPDLVLLDEPTDGVDPVGRRDIRDMLLSIRDRGKTIFINSHLLSELEMVCERVAIMVAGNIVTQGTMEQLTADRQVFELETDATRQIALTALSPLMAEVETNPGQVPPPLVVTGRLLAGEKITFAENLIRITTGDPRSAQPVLDALRNANVVVRRMQLIRPSLEQLFMEAVQNPATGKARAPGASLDRTARRSTEPVVA